MYYGNFDIIMKMIWLIMSQPRFDFGEGGVLCEN